VLTNLRQSCCLASPSGRRCETFVALCVDFGVERRVDPCSRLQNERPCSRHTRARRARAFCFRPRGS
jgi:hypothetical protein